MSGFNVLQLIDRIPKDGAAYRYLEDLRWGDAPECAHCGSGRVTFLNPANGTSRTTRTGAATQRRLWKSKDCRKQFAVLTNTIMHGTKIPVRTWVLVLYEMCAHKNGVAAREIERRYGLSPKSAWFILHRIRDAMDGDGISVMGTGVVKAAETWIGGKPSNRHDHKKGRGGQGKTDKTPLVSLINVETGKVRSRVVRRVTGDSLARVLAENVDIPAAELVTDESGAYFKIGGHFADHRTVNHGQGEYVAADGSTTNDVEGYFSQLKRSLDGTHHHVNVEHLDRYLAEFDFRFSTRKVSDAERVRALAGQMGGERLSYRPLVDGTAA